MKFFTEGNIGNGYGTEGIEGTEGKERQPRFMEESYPFAEHRFIKSLREGWEKHLESSKEPAEKKPPRTIGSVAETCLKILTEQDFGRNKKAWRKWIKKHVK